MKRANVMAPSAPVRARKRSRNCGDEPIYKVKQMHTVADMHKRIFTIVTGVALGVALTLLVGRLTLAWSLFPNRDVERSASYFHDVLKLVNANYVDAKLAD